METYFMTNQYYNFTDPAVSFAIVDGMGYNREMLKITEAFDNFPPAIQFTSGTFNYGEQTGGSSVDYLVNVPAIPTGTPYVPGNNVAGLLSVTNTGPVTLRVSLGETKGVRIGSAGAAVAGDLKAGGIYTFVYDGTVWYTLEMSTRYLGIAESKVGAAEADRDSAAADAAAAAAQVPFAQLDESNAATDAATASGAATAALASASTAAGFATTASSQASAASQSATTAGQRANAATTSNNTAQAAASNATSAASAAAGHATTAANNAAAAADSEQDAEDAAIAAQDILTDPGFNNRVRDAIRDVEMVVGSCEWFSTNQNPNTTYPGTTWVRLPANVSLLMAALDGTDVLQQVGSDTVTLTTATMPSDQHTVPNATSSSTGLAITLSNVDFGNPTISTFSFALKQTTSALGSPVTVSNAAVTASIASAGEHQHTLNATDPNGLASQPARVRGQYNPPLTVGFRNFLNAGAHTHSLTAPNHSHTFNVGSHSHSTTLPSHSHDMTFGPHSHFLTIGSHNHTSSLAVSSVGDGTAFSVVNSNLKLVAW